MTKKFKLLQGRLTPINADGSTGEPVESIDGILTGIVGNEQGKICFIFKPSTLRAVGGDEESEAEVVDTGSAERVGDDDVIRLYLDRRGRPAARLLVFLVSIISELKGTVLHIESDCSHGPQASRLVMHAVGSHNIVHVPWYLPEDYALRTDLDIRLIESALNSASASVMDFAGEGTASETARDGDGTASVIEGGEGGEADSEPAVQE